MGKIVPPFVRNPFNYDIDEASHSSGLTCPEQSLAQQDMKDECDINTIVRRFGLTGELPSNPIPPRYGDFTSVTDYHTAMNAVRDAMEGFMALPAELRARFANDPANLIAFLDDDGNREEATRLGLIPETLANVVGDAAPDVTA